MSDTMAQAPAGQGRGNGEAAPAMPRSFIVGSRRNDKPDFDQTITQTAAEQRLAAYQLSPSGYLRGLFLLVECTTAGNAAAVAYQEDGPFNVLSSIRFLDTNSHPMLGTLTGYDLYLVNKYGGYAFQGDAEASVEYTAVTGAGGTGGSFSFVLFLPVETVLRNALTSQLNKSGAAQFSLEMFVAATTTVYSVVPTTPGSIRVRTTLASWLDPEPDDAMGNPVQQDPPLLNSTQYWHKQNYSVLASAQFTRLQGIDGLLRMLLFVARRAASTRANGETDWPDPVSLKYEEAFLIQSRNRRLYRWLIAQTYGYDAAAEASKGRDNGVYPVWEWMQDLNLKPGGELSRSYLPMSSASNLELQGTWASAVSLDVLVNKMVPYPQGEVRGLSVL
jgi:hypothetical protein